jgi:putative lipoprotein
MSHGNAFNVLTILTRRGLLSFAAVALALSAAPAQATIHTLYGTVTYGERVALPPYAILEVSIIDLSIDPPTNVFAMARVQTRNRLPIPYSLSFDDSRLRHHNYALQARILVDGKVWFASLKSHSIHGPVQPEIVVERVVADATENNGPMGKWLAQSIRNAAVIDKLLSTIEIAADGKVTGNGGCNSFGGKATIASDKITFDSLTAAKLACSPAIMDQETKLLAALNDARRWLIDDQRGKLILFDAANKEILLFARM